MDKLDRLGWAAGCAFLSHGVRVGIRTNSPEVLEGLEKYFPLGWRPCTYERVHRLYSLIVGGSVSPNVRRYHLLYTDALRAVESLLMSSGQRTARRNAWTSVLEDRRRAKDRVEVERVLEAAVASRTS